MRDHDPNGVDWRPTWKVYGYSSFEAYIESKAGACPPRDDWPMPEPREPNCPKYEDETAEEHYERTCTGDAGNTGGTR